METASALTVVPPWQVNTAGVVVAFNESLCAFINIFLTVASRESRRTDTLVRSHTGTSVSATLFTECFADGAISHVTRLAGAAVSLDCVGTDGIFVAVVLSAATIIMLRTREVIHTDVSWDAVTAIQPRQVDTHGVGMTIVHFSCTLINIFTVCRVALDRDVSILALTGCFCIPIFAFRVFSALRCFCTEVMTWADPAALILWKNMILC